MSQLQPPDIYFSSRWEILIHKRLLIILGDLDFCKNDPCVISTNGRNLFTHIIELNRFLANARNDKLGYFMEIKIIRDGITWRLNTRT